MASILHVGSLNDRLDVLSPYWEVQSPWVGKCLLSTNEAMGERSTVAGEEPVSVEVHVQRGRSDQNGKNKLGT